MTETEIRSIAEHLMAKHAKTWKHWDEVCKEEVMKAMIELYNNTARVPNTPSK
jgi:hypothetical protein